jgi:hypothetical protein
MPYTTIDSIFKRKIANSSVSNVIKICKALGISADELADGKIVPVIQTTPARLGESHEIREHLDRFKMELAYMDDPTLDGEPVDRDTVLAIAQGIDVSYETVKRYNKNHNKNHNKNQAH